MRTLMSWKTLLNIVRSSPKTVRLSSSGNYNAPKVGFGPKGFANAHVLLQKDFCDSSQKQWLEQETIDLLQGRTPKSVFAKHFRPDSLRKDSKFDRHAIAFNHN